MEQKRAQRVFNSLLAWTSLSKKPGSSGISILQLMKAIAIERKQVSMMMILWANQRCCMIWSLTVVHQLVQSIHDVGSLSTLRAHLLASNWAWPIQERATVHRHFCLYKRTSKEQIQAKSWLWRQLTWEVWHDYVSWEFAMNCPRKVDQRINPIVLVWLQVQQRWRLKKEIHWEDNDFEVKSFEESSVGKHK